MRGRRSTVLGGSGSVGRSARGARSALPPASAFRRAETSSPHVQPVTGSLRERALEDRVDLRRQVASSLRRAGDGASRVRVASAVRDSRANGRVPVNSSNATTASAYRSLAGDERSPIACSGARYPAVPITVPVACESRAATGARDPEVGDVHVVVAVEQQVARLDVAMHDPARVGVVERTP